MSALSLVSVTKRFGTRAVLDDVTLTIARGRTTVLLGPSGSGKSTVLRLATGLLAPDRGSVLTLGDDFSRLRRRDLFAARARLGVLFQDNALFSSLTVGENVAFPLVHVARMAAPAAHAKARALLASVGLEETFARLPDQLSGGQQKRVALARAIALEPELVLFDEPTSGLDPQTSASIDDLIARMQERLGISFVVITHDIESARTIAHDAALLVDGAVRAAGTREQVWRSDDPRVRAFLERRPPPEVC
jgi:phospholipid/cholesterol/gamma-HCH transport system ATP-binding protein